MEYKKPVPPPYCFQLKRDTREHRLLAIQGQAVALWLVRGIVD